jgi:hypothetical protein
VANTTPNRSQHPRATKSIGLWGAPASGKTTYLGALYFAVTRSTKMDLNIFGVNDDSTEFMVSSSDMLSADHMFPPATLLASSFSWTMNMTTQIQMPQRGTFGRQNLITVPQHRQFNLDLRDAPGGWHGSQKSQPNPAQSRVSYGGGNPPSGASPSPVSDIDELMDYLAGCEGLLLLIDPVRELQAGDSHRYFQSTLLKIAQRRLSSMGAGARLPHYVAVCITKFDDPLLYKFARLNGYRSYNEDDPYLFPRVHDDDAEAFFKELCSNSAMGDADLICNALSRFFDPERIRYFVTSAIGFYRQGSRFRDDDYQNTVDQSDGTFRIRGQIHPINVLEPILWLGQSVTTVN